MNWYLRNFAALLPLVLMLLTGCSNRTVKPPVAINKEKAAEKASDVFRTVLETFRYPDNPRPTDDWTRFREGFQHLNSHFSRSEVMTRMRLSPEERKFLVADAHLTEDELAEVEASSFRTPDAHYLDECFLLRDAARFVLPETSGLSLPDQAQRHFRWVMRNAYLHEQNYDWVPPAFVMRRGFGSAVDRALVFLAFLRQSNIEGCLIVVPEKEPKQFLVAALDDKTGKTPQLLLFDPRLGMALPGKDGKGIATLQEALDDPKLLTLSLFTAEDAKKLQAWLVCPLYALSPRMLELQKGLSAHDTIVLHLNALQLHQSIAKATKLPVKVWNPEVPAGQAPSQEQTLPNSPTRCLRMFLPKQEGGLDSTNRAGEFFAKVLPIDQIVVNYDRINLRPVPFGPIPEGAYKRLLDLTVNLLVRYDVQTREMFLRGLYEPVLRRQDRLQAFARNDSLVGLADDKTFRDELADWSQKVGQAHLNLITNPNDAKALTLLQSLWSQDQFLGWLLNLETEEKLNREIKKSTLTGILAIGVRDYFDFELARYQASFNQEKAERAQTHVQASAKPTKSARNKAHEAWIVAKSSWSNFYLERIALEDTIRRRLKLINDLPSMSDVGRDISRKTGLLEQLHREVHLYGEAKWRLAECLAHLEGEKSAQSYLDRLKTEIEKLEKDGLMQTEIKSLRETVSSSQAVSEKMRAVLQQRLDLLARDWSERGTFFWMKQHIQHNPT